jgi:phosphoglycerate kinase
MMTYNKKTIRDIELRNRTILLRVDFNVPLADGQVTDAYRLEKSLPTIQYLRERNCKVILCSHLGRPNGQVDPNLSLEPVAAKLQELGGFSVGFVPASLGDQVTVAVKALAPTGVLLLENLRFNPGEQHNDREFARSLSEPFEYFVQDAFGTVHDKHASTDAIAEFLPSVMGLLVEKEVQQLSVAIDNPVRPLVTIIGGAKIADKIELIERFILQSNTVVIGGVMANTFLLAQGQPIGLSLYEPDEVEEAQHIMTEAQRANIELVLPDDVGVALDVSEAAQRRDVPIAGVESQDHILDFGPQSTERVLELLGHAGTIIWNGPLGMTELPSFATSSKRVAELVASQHLNCVVGGGDTAGFVHGLGLGDAFTHVSTGGGASLTLLAGQPLPGVMALMDK